MDYANSQRADSLSASYVAGTLRGPARRRFEALLPSHPALQRAVRDWQGRLMPLTSALKPETPSPAVWQRIEAALWPAAAAQPWWQKLALWRSLSGAALAAVVGLAVLVATLDGATRGVQGRLDAQGVSLVSAQRLAQHYLDGFAWNTPPTTQNPANPASPTPKPIAKTASR